MATENTLLDRVRKLLAKAEDSGVTPAEAEALTVKAAELMAKYGIERAMLGAARPETDRPGSRIIDIANPWAQVRAHLLAGLAGAMRCQSSCSVATGRARVSMSSATRLTWNGSTSSTRRCCCRWRMA